jgi:hypothetical protein
LHRAAIAQLVEHIIRNDGVGGSSPSCGTTLLPIGSWSRAYWSVFQCNRETQKRPSRWNEKMLSKAAVTARLHPRQPFHDSITSLNPYKHTLPLPFGSGRRSSFGRTHVELPTKRGRPCPVGPLQISMRQLRPPLRNATGYYLAFDPNGYKLPFAMITGIQAKPEDYSEPRHQPQFSDTCFHID